MSTAINWKSDAERLFELLRQKSGHHLYEEFLRNMYDALWKGGFRLADFGSSERELDKIRRKGSWAILRQISKHLSVNPTDDERAELIEQAEFEAGKRHADPRKIKRFLRKHPLPKEQLQAT